MNPASKDIADFIDDNTDLGLVLGRDLFYGRLPENPSIAVCVFDNPGDGPSLTLDKATSNYFHSSISVRVRHNDYVVGWRQIFAITEYLHGLNQQEGIDSSSYYGVIKAMNDPQVLYWDKNDRVIFFVNFEIQRKPN